MNNTNRQRHVTGKTEKHLSCGQRTTKTFMSMLIQRKAIKLSDNLMAKLGKAGDGEWGLGEGGAQTLLNEICCKAQIVPKVLVCPNWYSIQDVNTK